MIETKMELDEATLRRPDFRGGEPIELVGNTFYFPKPFVVYRPRFGGGVVSGRMATDLGPDFEAALDELDGLGRERQEGEPAPTRNFVDALMNLAVIMLRINYGLTDEQLGDLLVYRPDDDASQETWLSIVDVARGRGPKHQSASTGSHS